MIGRRGVRSTIGNATAEAVSVAALAVVLYWAVRRPRGLPEAVTAVPAAALVVAIGAVTTSAALAEARRLAPVVGFLGCVLVLAKLCDDEGLFRYLGAWLSGSIARSTAATGAVRAIDPGTTGRGAAKLFQRVFVVAAVTTAVLSLDATVVLLTPVVLDAARRAGARARPHAYACGHLANSASLLLPVSNLTNLLAFSVSGLSFGEFAALMALPWLAAIAVEYAVIRRFFAADLEAAGRSPGPTSWLSSAAVPRPAPGSASGAGNGDGDCVEFGTACEHSGGQTGELGAADASDPGAPGVPGAPDVPVVALSVVTLTLGGFVVASAAGINPAWAALGGALLLTGRALIRGETSVAAVARSADVPFLLFVLALGIVVTAVVGNGLGTALRPALASGSSLPALLAIAGLAAVLAALVNNLPAVLVLLPLAVPSGAGAVLAVLLGVNIGPNLTYTGSLATLLWRRVLHRYDLDTSLGEFTRLAMLTVPSSLTLSVIALWVTLLVLHM